LVEATAAGLTPITADDVDAFFERVRAVVEEHGGEIIGDSDGGAGADVWQGNLAAPSLEAVERALAAIHNDLDYDAWIGVMAATKAATQGDEGAGFELFANWSATAGKDVDTVTADKWESIRAPYRVGWDYLGRLAAECTPAYNAAAEEFEAIPSDEQAPADGPLPAPADNTEEAAAALTDIFGRYVWVESQKRAVDLITGDTIDREQFNARNWQVGDPADSKQCAWAKFMREGGRRRTVQGVTYRPGQGLFVQEDMPGLSGLCVNQWRAPEHHNLPATASDADVGPWLDLVAFVLPNEAERTVVLDWMAWVAQFPAEKPNWALVMGSTAEGIGKDTLLLPLCTAIGQGNVREITPGDLASGYSWWAHKTKLVIVEEMHTFERKETMNRLKPLVAAPPYTITVNAKYQPQFEAPNILAAIFFTNEEAALAISGQDRRYFVTWNHHDPRPDGYYAAVHAWYKAGGRAAAARWLLDRDVSTFDARGKAPMTGAKENMRQASRSLLDEWVQESIKLEDTPFDTDIVALEDVWRRMPDWVAGKGPKPTIHRLAGAMRKARCLQVVDRVRLGRPLPGTDQDRARLYAVRRAEMLSHLPPDKLRDIYWEQRDKAAG
jgi:hypothetical protein